MTIYRVSKHVESGFTLIERLVAVSDKEWLTDEDLPYEFHMARIETSRPASSNLLEEADDAGVTPLAAAYRLARRRLKTEGSRG